MALQHILQVSLHCGAWQRFSSKSLFPATSAYPLYILLTLILQVLLKVSFLLLFSWKENCRFSFHHLPCWSSTVRSCFLRTREVNVKPQGWLVSFLWQEWRGVGRGKNQARADKEDFRIIKINGCNGSSKKCPMWYKGRAVQCTLQLWGAHD